MIAHRQCGLLSSSLGCLGRTESKARDARVYRAGSRCSRAAWSRLQCVQVGVCDWNCRDRTGRHAPKRSALGGALSHGLRPPLTAPHMGCEAAAGRSPSGQSAGLGLLLLCQHVTAKGARLTNLYSVEFTFSFCHGANEMQFNLGYGVPGVSRHLRRFGPAGTRLKWSVLAYISQHMSAPLACTGGPGCRW